MGFESRRIFRPPPPATIFLTFIPIVILASFFYMPVASGLDCFKCVSLGGDNPACEDPFHNNFSADILESPCMGGRKQRNGLFPATACLKLSGVYEDTGQSMVVRGCGLDSGTLTVDTEIVRMSHCGGFYFDQRYVRGCLQSCPEDACNHAASLFRLSFSSSRFLFLLLLLPLLLLLMRGLW